jgi:sec-independent protein translocase protein TatC
MKDTVFYLTECRRRLLHALIVTAAVWLLLSFFSNKIYYLIALPLLHHLSGNQGLIATSVPGPFLVPFKCAFVVSLFLTIPFWLYQIWKFIFPALYSKEKQFASLLFFSSIGLFYMGVLFAYWVVLPLLFEFFLSVAPAAVEVRPDIGQYLDFVIRIFFSFGLAFELPIVIILLVLTGICSYESLVKIRPYVIVGAFVVGMFMTSPDVVSQISLALPLWGLYEVGLFFAKFLKKRQVTT